MVYMYNPDDFINENPCEECDGTGRALIHEEWAQYVELDQLPECDFCGGTGNNAEAELTNDGDDAPCVPWNVRL